MKKKLIFTDFNDWLTSVDEKAFELIDIGPDDTSEYRADIIYEIVIRATSESLSHSNTSDNPKEIANKALFKSVLISKGRSIPKEIRRMSESYKTLAKLKNNISEKLTNNITMELEEKWLKDPDVKSFLKKLEKDIHDIFIGVGEYKTRGPYRQADLLLNGVLYKCHLAFKKQNYYSKNIKIDEFINTLYNREVFPSKTGGDLVRKRINYLFKTKSEESMEKQWKEIFKYASSRFELRFDLEGKGTLLETSTGATAK